jgi:signal peptidase I
MGKLTRGIVWIAIILGVIGVFARLVFIDVWTIPDDGSKFGLSLEPSLSAGDTVMMFTRGEVGFGDLVRCADPDDATGFVVGRVAGLSSDTVETRGAELTVNGKRYLSEMVCPEPKVSLVHPTSGDKVTLTCDQVQMGGRLHYRGQTTKYDAPTPMKTTVGNGMLFLLSDDRSYHEDSRDFGTVPVTSCKNRIFFRLWSKSGWMDDKHRLSYIR